jgi:ADP-heptose:LPS heptosyltransferase
MLLSLESAIGDEIIDVFSHFKNVQEFYRPFGVTVNRFKYFSSLSELWSLGVKSEALPRTKYPQFKLPKIPIEPPNDQFVIGIHIEGSKFSNEACRQYGRPIKDMNLGFLAKLIAALNSREAFPYVFCSPARRPEVDALFKENYNRAFKVIAFDDVWASLACVAHCQTVLATDSAIKTMAAVLKIPSIVLAGDYPDAFRDEVFLTPYVNDGIMRVIKFNEIDSLDPCEIIEKLLGERANSIRKKLLKRRSLKTRKEMHGDSILT